MTPGDEYVDPLIKRGEELERHKNSGAFMLLEEEDELASIKAYARARLAHLSQFPLANSSQEESAQYLAQQEARSVREREEAFFTVLRTLGRLGGPLLLALLKAELTKGVDSLDLPPALRPFVDVMESAVGEAGAAVVKDVTG